MTMPRSLACIAFLGFLALAQPAGAQEVLASRVPVAAAGAPGDAQEEKIERRWAVASDVSIRFSGSVGTLVVEGWNRDSLVVTGRIPRGARFEGGTGGDGLTPARGAKMFLETADATSAATATLTLRVPSRARVWIKSGTAKVEVRDVAGGVDVNVVGGRVYVAASPRELQVEAMDADVEIDGSPAWVRAKTATGSVVLRGTSGDAALSSVSGALRVEGGAMERGRLETVTGDIHFGAQPARGAAITLDSHSGTIELLIPERGDFEYGAAAVAGTVDNRYNERRPTPGREGRGGELTIGRGDPRAFVTARTFKGTIVLARAAKAR